MALQQDIVSSPHFHNRHLNVVRALHRADERAVLDLLTLKADIRTDDRKAIQQQAVALIESMRAAGKPGLMESFLAAYSLSTATGVALMCLAEALLRVPDAETADRLIEAKIRPHTWTDRLQQSESPLVRAATVALMLAKRVLAADTSPALLGPLGRTVKHLGKPALRTAMTRAMAAMGDRFVLGQSIAEALKRSQGSLKKGYLYSYDVLGEAALSAQDAANYLQSYHNAIAAIGKTNVSQSIATAPSISVKLSALHPRFEFARRQQVLEEIVPRLRSLALAAKTYGIGLSVDAEEADRLEMTLEVVAATLEDPRLQGWDGFGLAIQAYSKRASAVIDWFYHLATALDRRVTVRLVKGAYWDTEIKRAQVDGVPDFPVFTQRAATDISYICCAKQLLEMADRIYPQFATHNAHTAAAILQLAGDGQAFEFQRLHGMGETLHDLLLERYQCRSRIYAPVGPHADLLAYLVRRLLENGANSSFVNQIVDRRRSAQEIAADPFERWQNKANCLPADLKNPRSLYAPERPDSRGWDIHNADDIATIERWRAPFASRVWWAGPITAVSLAGKVVHSLYNPANPQELVSKVTFADEGDAARAIAAARIWQADAATRANVLRDAADRLEDNTGEIFALLAREAGKTLPDAIGELREAVDFLRYYASRAVELDPDAPPLGIVSCISPWNFPLAIFVGQVAAALAVGNAVIAKPAETTPAIAALAVKLLHAAGVPRSSLQYLPGPGASVGRVLTGRSQVNGVCFTGSLATARKIYQNLAEHTAAWTPFVAETGGLNAAIVDSTALPERAVGHVITSAFRSAGQRCSALRLLCVQADIADKVLEMLFGAMDELALGNAWELATDIGPVISQEAKESIDAHIHKARKEGRVLKELQTPSKAGWFVAPTVISIDRYRDLQAEVFGPVLHVLRFAAADYDATIEAVNGSGYGLTFGLHTRIDARAEAIASRLNVGNLYVNRSQIGAIVGSQPFGGEGLSGTGPKAGGPRYVRRFLKPTIPRSEVPRHGPSPTLEVVREAIERLPQPQPQRLSADILPGPTGERNELTVWPRGVVLCLGPCLEDAQQQAAAVRRMGSVPLIIAPGATGPDTIAGTLERSHLECLDGFDVVVLWGPEADCQAARRALARRQGPIVPLVTAHNIEDYCIVERHLCIDTTAAGGNAALLATIED